jgi:hypothetical protein
VARSTTPGGRCVVLRHGEALDFSENSAVVVVAGATATTARSSSSSKRRRREDATVRFRSSSLVRGALRPGLSSILSPLPRFRRGAAVVLHVEMHLRRWQRAKAAARIYSCPVI